MTKTLFFSEYLNEPEIVICHWVSEDEARSVVTDKKASVGVALIPSGKLNSTEINEMMK